MGGPKKPIQPHSLPSPPPTPMSHTSQRHPQGSHELLSPLKYAVSHQNPFKRSIIMITVG